MTAPRSRRADELGDEQRIAEIRARAEAATPGPWVLDEQFPRRVYCDDTLGSCVADCNMSHAMILTREDMGRNAEFVAGARDDVPYLLDLVQSLRTQLAEARREFKTLKLAVCLDEGAVNDRIRDRYFDLRERPNEVDAEYERYEVLKTYGFYHDAARSPSPETEG